jgi:hypothetical protein
MEISLDSIADIIQFIRVYEVNVSDFLKKIGFISLLRTQNSKQFSHPTWKLV